MHLKNMEGNNIKIISIDDGRFETDRNLKEKTAPLFCILFDNFEIKKVKIHKITVDGLDATKILIDMLKGVNFDLVLLSGISFAGFNLINVEDLFNRFNKPIIVVSGTKPRNNLVKNALKKHFTDWKERYEYIKILGKIYCIKTVYNTYLFFEVIGINYKKAKRILRELTLIGKYPEPIRIVRLLAKDLG